MTCYVVVTQDEFGLLDAAYLFENREKAFKFAGSHKPAWILEVKEADAQ